MVIIVMGVAGSGKTTIGLTLAERLHCSFYDGDDFHPKENIDKMASGIPLNDGDRMPWLKRINELIIQMQDSQAAAVIACSALRKAYREILTSDTEGVHLVYLKGDYEQIWRRMRQRSGHYMKAEMLQSQFDTLEEPQDALVIDIGQEVDTIVDDIIADLGAYAK